MKQLDTNQIYEEWSQKVLTKSAFQANRLFIVEKQHRDGKVVCRLRVNYAPEIIVVAKEVDCFVKWWMGNMLCKIEHESFWANTF